MKLELVKKYEPNNIQFFLGNVSLNEEITISLTINDENNYSLLLMGPDEIKYLPLNYLDTFLKVNSNPVLFSMNGGFGIIKGPSELFYYQGIDSNPERIKIDNKKFFQQVLPTTTQLRYQNPVSNTNTIPVCFQHTSFCNNDARYIAFLKLNIEKRKAKWESWTNLDNKQMPAYSLIMGKEPPKIDSVMIRNEDVFIFTSGTKLTSVSKWGMDYYSIVKTDIKGGKNAVLLDSGNLHLIDQKKRGVNGVFTSSEQYAILTPVFQSDEWKGKQKLFSVETTELINIEFPRGFGKYPQIVQHTGKSFLIYLRDTKHFAICREI